MSMVRTRSDFDDSAEPHSLGFGHVEDQREVRTAREQASRSLRFTQQRDLPGERAGAGIAEARLSVRIEVRAGKRSC